MNLESMKPMKYMTEPELSAMLTGCANALLPHLPPGPGTGKSSGKALFVLLVADETNIGQYISNCRREDMIKFLRETADRLESRQTVDRLPVEQQTKHSEPK